MKFRFNLQWMLIAVALAGVALALVTQIGMGIAEFEVWENNLSLNDDGLVEGELRLGYEGDEYYGTTWPYDCRITNVSRRSLLDLKPGIKTRVRYRISALGPLKKQEPCAYFLTRSLGINQSDIVGYVTFKGGTEVVINGRQ
jgi:hypothetical protein